MTAEIFLIWTDVTRSNVAWTHVNLIGGSVLDFSGMLPVEFRQGRVGDSWDITMTSVVWAGVGMTVWICSRCSQEPTFKIGSVTTEILLTLSFCWWWWWGWTKSFSCLTLTTTELQFSCGWFRVSTIALFQYLPTRPALFDTIQCYLAIYDTS